MDSDFFKAKTKELLSSKSQVKDPKSNEIIGVAWLGFLLFYPWPFTEFNSDHGDESGIIWPLNFSASTSTKRI